MGYPINFQIKNDFHHMQSLLCQANGIGKEQEDWIGPVATHAIVQLCSCQGGLICESIGHSVTLYAILTGRCVGCLGDSGLLRWGLERWQRAQPGTHVQTCAQESIQNLSSLTEMPVWVLLV